MMHPRFMPYVLRQITRYRVRSLLTVAGVGTAMFLFVAIDSMQRGVAAATQASAEDSTLVVYREDRFCPFTSRLPEYYQAQIEEVEGVRSVVPMRIVVNNCRASLDVVTFRGVPRAAFVQHHGPLLRLLDGSLQGWERRSDAALVGETLAGRRGLRVGDRFDAAGVTVYVAGVFASEELQDRNVAYVHLDFLQQTTDGGLGVVTQFNVKVTDATQLEPIARRIDEVFASAEHPTSTRSEKAFVAQVAGDVIELVRFTRVLGWGCLVAVLALVGNAIVLSVQGRIKEHAVLQTLGYDGGLIARLIIAEGVLLGLAGGTIGTGAAVTLLRWSRLSMSVDGLSLPLSANLATLGVGLGISVLLGVLAGLVPAWQASVRPISTCFRAV